MVTTHVLLVVVTLLLLLVMSGKVKYKKDKTNYHRKAKNKKTPMVARVSNTTPPTPPKQTPVVKRKTETPQRKKKTVTQKPKKQTVFSKGDVRTRVKDDKKPNPKPQPKENVDFQSDVERRRKLYEEMMEKRKI